MLDSLKIRRSNGSPMKHKKILLLLLAAALTGFSAAVYAADGEGSFFGIKKGSRKGIPANPPKKKVKGIPANPSPEATWAGSDSELTEEEKSILDRITGKAPKTPKAPPTAPKDFSQFPHAPTLPPRNPNDYLVRVPQAPVRIPLPPPDAPAGPEAPKKP